ncbi:MAG: DNA/RNA nuclease SfsA [Planctomycetes bacterium]|nr:DNA/RNA nuclease SfsA [Planctomycetota bacterium]
MAKDRVRALDLELFPASDVAEYVDRPNRFVVRARLGARTVRAHLPNPGRLGELLLPGARLRLVRRGARPTAVAVEGEDGPVIIDTGRTNAIARALLEHRLVPGLERARIVRAEAAHGRSRFDFLLDLDGGPFWLEVKSVTLLAGRTAMFPDAVTARGRRHIEELAEIARRGGRAGVLFVVHHPRARAFAPDWHTDPAFADAFVRCAPHLSISAIGIRTDPDLRIRGAGDPLPIPTEILRREIADRGAYAVILRLPRATAIDVGSLGRIRFPAGFYAYVGSAARILSARIARHRRLRKRIHWHIDALRARAKFVADVPIRSSRRDECDLARALAALGDVFPSGFGASDCDCPGHLIRFVEDPRRERAFHDLIAGFRTRAIDEALDAPEGVP